MAQDDNDLSAFWLNSGSPAQLLRPDREIEYRRIADLNRLILRNLPRLSSKFDAVIGISRGGLLAANLIALHLKLRIMTLNEFFSEIIYKTRNAQDQRDLSAAQLTRLLLIDDATNEGGTCMERIKDAVAQTPSSAHELTYMIVYALSNEVSAVDMSLEILDRPRVFEWNVMHHSCLSECLVDLDGILCEDGAPPENVNDDREYTHYITNACPNIIPTFPIGYIVTSRLEKYRDVTEAWLKRHSVNYGNLIMLNVESAERRRELKLHGRYKADVYRSVGGRLFIESEEWQARLIAKITKRPVLHLDGGVLYSD